MVTSGDRIQDRPLVEVGGKGLFIKEIEEALLEEQADFAVHSIKDVPAELAPGLSIAAIPRREDPRDVLVSPVGSLAALPRGARVGTSSLRRRLYLLMARPDLEVVALRGNVDTRLRKVAEGVVDAGVLACAGMDRLGVAGRITQRLTVDQMLPAIGQGALAIEARADDARVVSLTRALSDPGAEATVAAERGLLAGLGVGCRTPVAGHAVLRDGRVFLRGLVGRPDASEIEAPAVPEVDAQVRQRRERPAVAQGARALPHRPRQPAERRACAQRRQVPDRLAVLQDERLQLHQWYLHSNQRSHHL